MEDNSKQTDLVPVYPDIPVEIKSRTATPAHELRLRKFNVYRSNEYDYKYNNGQWYRRPFDLIYHREYKKIPKSKVPKRVKIQAYKDTIEE